MGVPNRTFTTPDTHARGTRWEEQPSDNSADVYVSGDVDDGEASCMMTEVDVSASSKIVSFDPVFLTLSATVCVPQIVLADLEFKPVR